RRVGLLGIGWNLAPYDSLLSTSGTALTLTLAERTSYRLTPAGSGRWQNSTDPFLLGTVVTQTSGGLNFDLRFKDGTVHRYTPSQTFTNAAVLTAIVDRNGNTVTVARQTVSGIGDRITSITEPGGRSLILTYDTQGRLSTVTDPIGRRVQYTYDPQGRLSTVLNPAGGLTTYTYDTSDRILSITDPRGITFITNEYDSSGRVVRQKQADGSLWTFAYTTASTGGVTQTVVTDPRGSSTTHRFNGRGFTVSRTDALGQTTILEYTPGSSMLQSTQDALGRVTRFSYDSAGNVLSVTDGAGNSRTFTYEPTFSKPLTARDPLGNVTT